MPASLLGVIASSLSHNAAPRLVISGDSPNITEIIPELTNCAAQYVNAIAEHGQAAGEITLPRPAVQGKTDTQHRKQQGA